eukprot:GILI01022860.1.p1 GENE.GILI01022860.1~~GILI01022860.1.p1  ORF type:complete len:225 (-),score=34.54 GILI01022860.1:30-704(-)
MATEAKIRDIISLINCAKVHPPLPSGTHKRRPQAEIRGPPDVVELYRIIYDLYTTVEASLAFREPVDALAYKLYDYYMKVKNPMSLRIVLDRIADPTGGFYGSRDQVLSEVSQIWRNCELYNGNQSIVTEGAHQCERWISTMLQELEDGRPADVEAVDRFNDAFMAEAESDADAAERLMEFVKKLNPKLLTSDGDLELENLTSGEFRAMNSFFDGYLTKKRGRE